MTYTAFDSTNMAVCNFKIFVLRKYHVVYVFYSFVVCPDAGGEF